MPATTKLAILVTMPLTALVDLFWALFWPLTIGVAAQLVFGPDSTSYSIISFVCFLWGVARAWNWWNELLLGLHRTVRRPRRVSAGYARR